MIMLERRLLASPQFQTAMLGPDSRPTREEAAMR